MRYGSIEPCLCEFSKGWCHCWQHEPIPGTSTDYNVSCMHAGRIAIYSNLPHYCSVFILIVIGRLRSNEPRLHSTMIWINSIHTALDSSQFLFGPCCGCILRAVWSSRGVGRRTYCLHHTTVSVLMLGPRFLSNWRRCPLRHLGRRSPVSPTSLEMYVLFQVATVATHVTDGDSFTVNLQMISAASAQIEAGAYPSPSCFLFLPNTNLPAVGGRNFQKYVIKNGVRTAIPGYAEVQGIFIGAVAAFVILITIVGPEYVLASCVLLA